MARVNGINVCELDKQPEHSIWIVNACGGEWEDSYEFPVGAYSTMESAVAAAKRYNKEHHPDFYLSDENYPVYEFATVTQVEWLG